MSGIYLAIATLAIGILAEDIIVLLEPLTGGVGGTYVGAIALPWAATSIATAIPTPSTGCVSPSRFSSSSAIANLLRSSTGRAFVAIRDSEVSARAMGINIARFKTLSFFLSCMVTGFAGALMAHFLGAFNYEAFLITISIQMLLMIVVGGMGSIHGAFFGAMVVGFLPQRHYRRAPADHGDCGTWPRYRHLRRAARHHDHPVEPRGIYGQWLKTRTWFELFPLSRRDMFRRQKSYLKTERLK